MLTLLLVVSVVTWVAERNTSWAENWLPNFIAEWSGILIAVLVIERLSQAQRKRDEDAAYDAVYGPLRRHAGVAIGKALQPIIDLALTLAEATGLKTRPADPLVSFLSELWEWLHAARDGVADPAACLRAWSDTAEEVERRLRTVRANYFMALDPPDAIRQIDNLADVFGAEWLKNEVGQPVDATGVATLIGAQIYQATGPLGYLARYFETMVGAPLTTGPWHVSPEEQGSWRTSPEPWARLRDEARRLAVWADR